MQYQKVLQLLLVLASFCSATQKSYVGYKVYTVEISGENQAKLLSDFTSNENFDFWTPFRKVGFSDVMVRPEAHGEFEGFLKVNRIPYNIRIENVERVFEEERLSQMLAPKVAKGEITFTKYHRYSEILDYVKGLTVKYPNITSLEVIGKTTEGRDLVVLEVSSGGSTNKSAILIDAGIHAREWISPAVVLYIIQQLVENPANKNLIKNVDWHIIPDINPDGYEYSHTKDRMWRKTRSKGTKCYGTDPNRNFDFHWGGPGTSDQECSEIYKGPKPFSEPETRALRDYALKNPKKFNLYLTFHSYGWYILHPWGYTNELVENEKEHKVLGNKARVAIKNYNGTTYTVGGIVELLDYGAGGSDDWMKGVGGAEFSYCVELPGPGFVLPPSKILPVVKETFEGVKAFHGHFEK